MALSIVSRLRTGRFDAASLAPTRPEWPPNPARVFCALVASAGDSESDRAALSVLENAGHPVIHASPEENLAVQRRSGFVVTNTVSSGGGSMSWPGRTNGVRKRISVVPECGAFALVWPDLDVDDATLGRLMRLAWNVPYIGRTTSDVEVQVVPSAVPVLEDQVVWRPVELGLAERPDAVVDVPYPGYREALDCCFDDGRPAWEAPRESIPYRWREPETVATALSGPWDELIVLGFARHRWPLSGQEGLRAAETLRQAVLSHLVGDAPQVTGHGADDRPHVAYLSLPNVGYQHSDGSLMGVAAAIPGEIPKEDYVALVRALNSIERLNTRHWSISLESAATLRKTASLSANRWCGPRGGACEWITATPVMLDKFPQGKVTAYHRIAESLQIAGFPEPVEIELFPSAPLSGGIRRPLRSASHRREPNRPYVHCRVRFAEPVVGPVIAGAMRFLGMGLFVPDTFKEEHRDQST